MPLYEAILERYGTMSFSLPDGSLNPYTMIPMVTELLRDYGLKGEGSVETVADICVYPPDWFNPYDDLTGRLKKTGNTHTIHWYAKSWMEAEPAWKAALKRVARRVLGKEFFLKLKRFS